MTSSPLWVFFNGVFCLETAASIPITDRGLVYGDGIFTTLRVYQGHCEFFGAHYRRLYEHATLLHFELPIISFAWIQELILRNHALNGIWRLKILITVQQKHLERAVGNLLITLTPHEDIMSEYCRLILFPVPMYNALAHIKTLSYLEHVYTRQFAWQSGYDDAVITSYGGILMETSCANIFWIVEQKCYIPDFELPYLKGILLQTLMQYMPYPTIFIRATLEQIPETAHIYLCNALLHIKPVVMIDHRHFAFNFEQAKCLKEAIMQALADNLVAD